MVPYSQDRSSHKYLLSIFYVICVAGFSLSAYAWYGRLSTERNFPRVLICDVSESVNCTKAFRSRYGRGFGLVDRIVAADNLLNLPNGAYHVIYYSLQAFLANRWGLSVTSIQVAMSCMSVCLCVYLNYILIFVLKDVCILCNLMHVTNISLFIACVCKYLSFRRNKQKNI